MKPEIKNNFFPISFQLFFYGLIPDGDDYIDMVGYKTDTIKKAINNEKKKKSICTYCKKPNATVVCFDSKCKIQFHVPCGMKEHALFQFMDKYETYCHTHANDIIKYEKLPPENTNCMICMDPLGDYNPVNCFQPKCCIEKLKLKKEPPCWMHYRCVMEGARNLGHHFNCFAFWCGKIDETIKRSYNFHGIFIPARDATYDTGANYSEIDQTDDVPDLETTYDTDATIFQNTFGPIEPAECDYEDRCVGERLGKLDIVNCLFQNCESFAHVKCLRYHRHIKTNAQARQEKFCCKNCLQGCTISHI